LRLSHRHHRGLDIAAHEGTSHDRQCHSTSLERHLTIYLHRQNRGLTARDNANLSSHHHSPQDIITFRLARVKEIDATCGRKRVVPRTESLHSHFARASRHFSPSLPAFYRWHRRRRSAHFRALSQPAARVTGRRAARGAASRGRRYANTMS
jgi:hypothetical protein